MLQLMQRIATILSVVVYVNCDVSSLFPRAHVATVFDPSPLTLITPPVEHIPNDNVPFNILNLNNAVIPSDTLELPFGIGNIPQGIFKGAITNLIIPTLKSLPDLVHAHFKNKGDNVVHSINSGSQKFQFTLPKVEVATASDSDVTINEPEIVAVEEPSSSFEIPLPTVTVQEVPSGSFETAPKTSYEVPHSTYQAPSNTYNAPSNTYAAPIGFNTYGLPKKDEETLSTPIRNDKFLNIDKNEPIIGKPIISNLPGFTIPIELSPPLVDTPTISLLPPIPISEIKLPTLADIPKLFNNQPAAGTPNGIDQLSIPINGQSPIHLPVNKQVNIIGDKNQYTHGFSLPDGTKLAEQGKLITTDNGWEYVIAKTGSYEYISPEGIPVKVKWIADQNGFRHL